MSEQWWIPKQKQYLESTKKWHCDHCDEITPLERNPKWDGAFKGDWPAVRTVFTATSVEQNPPHRESGQSNSLTLDPLYRANVLGESTGVLVFTDTGGTETKVYEGGVGTYTFYTITSEPPPGEVQPPGGVGVGGE